MDAASRINTHSPDTLSKQQGVETPDVDLCASDANKLNLQPPYPNTKAIGKRTAFTTPPALGVLSIKSLEPPEITVNDQQFFDECQALLRRTVLKPLKGEGVRHIHGAIHSSRVAMWIPVLLSVRRSLGDPEAIAFSDDMLPWVMKAALLHDSGRKADASYDTKEEEAMSGEHCENHLLSIGCPATLARTLNKAICNKDGHFCANKTFIEKLIHDADCLEIMRVPDGSRFDIARLDVFRDLKSKGTIDDTLYKLADQVRTVIHQQHDMMKDVIIINSETGFKEKEQKSTGKANLDNTLKAPMEHSVNALQSQLLWLKENARELYCHYVRVAKEPPQTGLTPQRMGALEKLSGVDVPETFDARYRAPETGKEYLVRAVENAAIARKEILMAHISRQLGMNSPIVEMVQTSDKTQLCYECQPQFRLWEQDHHLNELIVSILGEENLKNSGLCDAISNTKRHKSSAQPENTAPLESAVTQLLNTDTSAITRLIEAYGPDTFLDCEHLKRTIHDRLAHLARLYPQCCHRQPMPVEQQAVNVAGARGYSLPVSFKDIEPGSFVISQGISEHGEPYTEIQTKLRPQATQKLARSLGLPELYTTVFQQIEGAEKLRGKYLSQASINVLNELADMCGEAINDINHKLSQYPSSAVEQIAKILSDAQTQCKRAACENLSSPVNFSLPKFNLSQINDQLTSWLAHQSDEAHSIHRRYKPVREKAAFSDKNIHLGRAREEGYLRKIRSDIAGIHSYHLRPGKEVPGALQSTEIIFFSNDLPSAFSMEGVLRLRTPGAGEGSTQALLDSLTILGIDTHRPNTDEVQEHYLNSLLESYRLDEEFKAELPGDLNIEQICERKATHLCNRLGCQSVPRWEEHHRTMAGRCIYYRPKPELIGTSAPEKQLKAMHKLGLTTENSGLSNIESVLHSGGALMPIVERLRLGIYQHSIPDAYLRGATDKVLVSVTSGSSDRKQIGLVFKPSLLRRTDMVYFPNDRYGDSRIASLRAGRLDPFTVPEELTGDNEALFTFISMEEVESIRAPQKEVDSLLRGLASDMQYWPDGRPLASIFHGVRDDAGKARQTIKPLTPEQQSIYEHLTGSDSLLPEMSRKIIKTLGTQQFATLLTNNPDLKNGKLESLADIFFSKKMGRIRDIDFRGINLAGVMFENTTFDKCNFSDMDLREVQCDQCEFEDCAFEDSRLKPQQIKGCTFSADGHFSPFEQHNHDLVIRICMDETSPVEGPAPSENAFQKLLNIDQVTVYAQEEYRPLTSLTYRDQIDDLCRKVIDEVKAPEMSDEILNRMLELAIRMRANQPEQQKLLKLIKTDRQIIQVLLDNNRDLLDACEDVPFNLKLDQVHFKKGTDFRSMDLSCCNLKGAHFKNSQFTQKQLKDQDLSDTVFFCCEIHI